MAINKGKRAVRKSERKSKVARAIRARKTARDQRKLDSA